MPTPSAPPLKCRPRYAATMVITHANETLFTSPVNTSFSINALAIWFRKDDGPISR